MKRVTVNIPDAAAPDLHDGEGLRMGVDEHRNLIVTDRTTLTGGMGATASTSHETLAIYASGFWADAQIEELET